MTAGYVDAHVHLQDPKFGGKTVTVLDQARAAGVRLFLCHATGEADWAAVLALADSQPDVRSFIGVHPWFVEQAAAGWPARLGEHLAACPAAGLGEVGLDRNAPAATLPAQDDALVRQLALAQELARPACLHCVQRWGRLLEVLRRFAWRPGQLLVHGFAGSAETARQLLALGAVLSFGPALAEPGTHGDKLRRVFRKLPLEQVLLETDAPHGAPEPAAVRELYAAAAGVRGLTVDTLAERLWQNAQVFAR